MKRLKVLTRSKSKTKKQEVDLSKEIQTKTQRRLELNKNVLILARTYKHYVDLIKFLYQYYIKKDNGMGFYDDRFRLHVNSMKEYQKRYQIFDIGHNDGT